MSVPSFELGPPIPSPARECVPPESKGAQHSPAGEGVGGPNSDIWRESLALCLLCGKKNRMETLTTFMNLAIYKVNTVCTLYLNSSLRLALSSRNDACNCHFYWKAGNYWTIFTDIFIHSRLDGFSFVKNAFQPKWTSIKVWQIAAHIDGTHCRQ